MAIKNQDELKNLTIEDWTKGVQLNLAEGLLGANEHRNIKSYPILDKKVKDIMASIKASKTTEAVESGLWWGQEGAIYGVPDISKIEFDDKGVCIAFPFTIDESSLSEADRFPVRRPSGHHRHEACKRLKFGFHPVTVRIINGRVRLIMMVNENHDTYKLHPRANMESIKQVKQTIEGSAREFDTFNEVNKAYPNMFASEKAWKYVLANGAGKGVIQKFLGDPWIEKDISLYLRMSRNVEKGYYTDDEMAKIGNKSVIDEYGRLVEVVSQQKWPAPFINEMNKELKRSITDAKNIVTVKSLIEARKNLVSGSYDPLSYLSAGTLAVFDVTKRLSHVMAKGIEEAKKEGVAYDPTVLVSQGYAGFETELGAAWAILNPPPVVEGADPTLGTPTKTDGEGEMTEAQKAAETAMSEVGVAGVDPSVLEQVATTAKEDDKDKYQKELINSLIALDVAVTHCTDMGITYDESNEVHVSVVKSWNNAIEKMNHFFGAEEADADATNDAGGLE